MAHDCATLGKSERYVSKLIRAALLAPDLVEAVLEGRAPSQLTLAELTKELPWDWNEQRRRFAAVRGVNRTPRDPDPTRCVTLSQTERSLIPTVRGRAGLKPH